jgi:hypothetical protein
MHDVNLFEGGRHRALSLERGGHVDRPELGSHSTAGQAGEVRVQFWLRLCERELREVTRGQFPDLPGIVVVAVKDGNVPEQASGPFDHGVGLLCRDGGNTHDQTQQQENSHSAIIRNDQQ